MAREKVGVIRGEEIFYTMTVSVEVKAPSKVLVGLLDSLMQYHNIMAHYRVGYDTKGRVEELHFYCDNKEDIDDVDRHVIPFLDKMPEFKRIQFPE